MPKPSSSKKISGASQAVASGGSRSPAKAPGATPGAAPGSTSGSTADAPVIRVFSIDGATVRDLEGDAALAELRRAVKTRSTRVWIDVTGGTPELLAELGKLLDLHPLLVEDLGERDQRAKIDQTDDIVHLVLFSLGFDDGTAYQRELDFVLGPRFLLSSHSRWWEPRGTHHLRTGIEPVLRRGPDYLLWALCDDTIDAYFPMLDRMGDELDKLEDEVIASAERSLLESLFALKRQLIEIRRVTAPEREMFNLLSSREETPVSPDNRLYFRDTYDHLIRLTDELDTYRDLASAALEAYLTTVNNNLSLIMKRLTGVTVVVAGVGAIGGLFGMSEAQVAFRLEEGPGFWIVVFASLVMAAIAAWVLRKIDWL